jgi:hypothetical protein
MKKSTSRNFINLMMGTRFTTLLQIVFRNGIGLNPKFILRFLSLLPSSLLVEIFILIEKIKYGEKIKKTDIEKPPVFIIGHWRSGTTFLQQLIHLDNQFTAPTVVQVITPEHFLISTKYWVPVLNAIMPKKRPMDEIEMKPLAPFEDEWALLRMGSETPLLNVFFPSSKTKFLSGAEDFIPKGENLVKWKNNFMLFSKKITYLTHKQIVYKNPFHTPRIPIIAGMFPGARFIHIVRHPYKIVPSAIYTWDIVSGQNALKTGWKSPSVEETAGIVNDFWQSVNENKGKLRENQFVEVKYEDLENNPVRELKRIYAKLNLHFAPELEASIIQFMEEKKNYKKNVFTLSHEDKTVINNILGHYLQTYNYTSE